MPCQLIVQASYSRLVYSIADDRPSTCLRDVTGSVSYSVRGWHINRKDFFTQAAFLLPMTLINLASLILLLTCFYIGRFQYQCTFDATNNVSLLTAQVVVNDGGEGRQVKPVGADEVKWGDEVQYSQPMARGGFQPIPLTPMANGTS